MAEHEYDDLARDLAALGRAVDVPAPGASLASASWSGCPRRPREGGAARLRRRRSPWRWRWRWPARAAGDPPVRAAVADWFGFGGVRVERGDAPAPTAGPTPPTVSPGVSLTEAAAMVGFTVSVPDALGEPDGVEVSADRRMVSMSWATDDEGVLRLDQFDARLDFSVLKTARDVEYAAVNDTDALWFEDRTRSRFSSPTGPRSRTRPGSPVTP